MNKTSTEWKKWINEGRIVPYFQPILSIENKGVYGYEVLGRIIFPDNSVHTLGEFLTVNPLKEAGESSSNKEFRKFQNSIDFNLREQAIKIFAKDSSPDSKLFINISPTLLMAYIDGKELTDQLAPTIQIVKNLGISPNRIVIEITEDYIAKKIEALQPLIYLYKDFGFMIAIDDLGSKASNLDRIGIFQPDIIKVDMQLLRFSLIERSYKEILFTLSRLGESLGISLLFEGVETIDEMHQAMSFGSRYVQGFLFDKAIENLQEKTKYVSKLNQLLDSFYEIKLKEIDQKIHWESKIEVLFQKIEEEATFNEDGTIFSHAEFFALNQSIFRYFVTDMRGNQLSPNYLKQKNSEIEIQRFARNSNWSWRPYFLNHLYESFRQKNNWVISQPYHDIAENLLLRTFSKTFKNQFILFVDVFYQEIDFP